MTHENAMSTDGMAQEEFCHRCSQNYPESDLTAVTTVINGIEAKEWVCPNCEPKARDDEKPCSIDTGTEQ